MKIQFVSPTLHGVLDYAAGGALILVPALTGFPDTAPLALGISVAFGAVLITYSLLTDYAYGVLPMVSYRGHLALDLSAAASFLGLPFLFGFEGLVAAYFWANAAAVTLVVAVSSRPSSLLSEEQQRLAVHNGRLKRASS